MAEDSRFDERDFRRKLRDWSRPHEIMVASDGEKAIDHLVASIGPAGASSFDIAILDLNMPRANGIQVLSFIRQNPGLARMPVIVWTTSDSPFDVAMSQDLRVDAYLLKRAKATMLRKTMDGLLAPPPPSAGVPRATAVGFR